MVVKGLDFATVALVGILSADSLLSYPDFRVNERAFQLMEQVSGRAGRADGAGRVLIQAYNLQHPTLKWVQEHDVNAYYEHEIKYREYFGYPPFTRLIKISLRHKDEPKAIEAGMLMVQALQQVDNISVQGPGPAIVSRVRNQYVQEVWVKCPRQKAIKHLSGNNTIHRFVECFACGVETYCLPVEAHDVYTHLRHNGLAVIICLHVRIICQAVASRYPWPYSGKC